jgi:alpha-galactosidase/6-phospho-beta-glucosidase family protein
MARIVATHAWFLAASNPSSVVTTLVPNITVIQPMN